MTHKQIWKTGDKKQTKITNNARDIKTKNTTLKTPIKAKLIFGHNFSLKFPLGENCKIPFNKNFFNYTKLPRGKFNVRYDFHHSQGFVRQTNKSLIIFPHIEREPAFPKNSFKLKARLSEKAFTLAKDLMNTNPSLHLLLPSTPSTEEYAIRDSYAHECDFTFENKYAKMDKSPHFEEGGYQGTGGELDWKSPEFADAYIRMPIAFMKAMKMFEANMASHVKAINKIANAGEQQAKAAVDLRKLFAPRRTRHFKTSFKKSATVQGCT